MEVLVTAVQELSLARDIEEVGNIVRVAARKLAGADGATFILKDGDNCYYADEDAIAPLWKGHRFPMHSCVSGWAMMHKEAAVIPDIYNDDRVPVEAYRPTFVKTMVMVPVRRLDPIAAIGNYWAEQHTPPEENIRLLQSLADITAVTIENINVYNELEKRVADRTAELKTVIQDLESFSYSVSHDLRAPLRGVMGYTQMLITDHGEELSDKGKEISQRILKNAGNMNQTIDDLMTFFAMSNTELHLTQSTMEDMVQSVCQDCAESAQGRTIEFTIGKLHPAQADTAMIRHVWSNIIQNAVKYSKGRERAIIEIGSEIKDGMSVYHIRDNGAGFDMNYYSQLFEVFKRLHSGRDFEGTGIGLAIVQRIMQRHGGEVWAESEIDKGSTFYFSLPKEVLG